MLLWFGRLLALLPFLMGCWASSAGEASTMSWMPHVDLWPGLARWPPSPVAEADTPVDVVAIPLELFPPRLFPPKREASTTTNVLLLILTG